MTRSRDVADTQDNNGGAVPPFAAGKNKIINGDFNINQRGFSSSTVSGTYGFDRWQLITGGDGTCTMSAQTFTIGTAPVAGYESTNFVRLVTASQTSTGVFSFPAQKIESVKTFANQTITISFWAKAASGTPKVAVEIEQNFGTGGSPSATVTNYFGQATLSTSWARYSVTGILPSISGKTIGTNNNDNLQLNFWVSSGSNFNSRTGSLGIQTGTFDFWGVQVEAGSTATAFQTATGTLQGELAACQRYFWQIIDGAVLNAMVCNANSYTTTDCRGVLQYPVTMRTAPTLVQTSSTNYWQYQAASSDSFDALTITSTSTNTTLIYGSAGVNGLTAGQGGTIFSNNSAARLALSAEL